MGKYFLSFTSTFESLLKGKITIDDLSNGIMVFGCKRAHVLLPYDQIPIEVTLNNKLKPHLHGDKHHSMTVTRDKIDADVLRAWDAFAAQIRKASNDVRLVFMHDIGHPSYSHFCQDMLDRGEQVFWKGEWQTSDEPVPATFFDTAPDPLHDPVAAALRAAIERAETQTNPGEYIDLAQLRHQVSRSFGIA
jgi:hypothetical protein